jgi:hypothetical protein
MADAFHAKMNFPGADRLVAYPGYYVTDAKGVITNQLFFEDEDEIGARSTPLGLLSKIVPETLTRGAKTIDQPHAKIELSQSDVKASWRNRIILRVAIDLPPGFHAYAPEVTGGYKPVKLEIPETEHYWWMPPVNYPKSRTISIPALGENLPVFEGKFQMTTEAAVKWADFEQVDKEKKTHPVEIRGTLNYQICNDKVCFPPEHAPVSWTVEVQPYDDQPPTANPVSGSGK